MVRTRNPNKINMRMKDLHFNTYIHMSLIAVRMNLNMFVQHLLVSATLVVEYNMRSSYIED